MTSSFEALVDLSNRQEAGRMLARALLEAHTLHDPLVVTVPRGGVPVAREIALACQAPLDLIDVVRMHADGAQARPLGCVTAGGSAVLVPGAVGEVGGDPIRLESARRRAAMRAGHRAARFRAELPALTAYGRDVILVDDFARTGCTLLAALEDLGQRHPRRIIVAVGAADRRVATRLRHRSDGVVVLATRDLAEVPFAGQPRILDIEVMVDVRAARQAAATAMAR